MLGRQETLDRLNHELCHAVLVLPPDFGAGELSVSQ